MTVMAKLTQHLLDWFKFIPYTRQKRFERDNAVAEYKHQRAKFIVAYKAQNPSASAVVCESAADADDVLHGLYLARLLAESEAESCKDKLIWYRSNADALRSEKVDEREANKLYSENAV